MTIKINLMLLQMCVVGGGGRATGQVCNSGQLATTGLPPTTANVYTVWIASSQKKYLMLFRATLKKYVRSLLAGLISSHGQEFINFGQHLNGWYCQYYIGNPCLWQDPLLLENYICTYALMNKPDPSFAILSTCQW